MDSLSNGPLTADPAAHSLRKRYGLTAKEVLALCADWHPGVPGHTYGDLAEKYDIPRAGIRNLVRTELRGKPYCCIRFAEASGTWQRNERTKTWSIPGVVEAMEYCPFCGLGLRLFRKARNSRAKQASLEKR